jgi:hypothetical protein
VGADFPPPDINKRLWRFSDRIADGIDRGNILRESAVLQDERTLGLKENEMKVNHKAIARKNIFTALVLVGFIATTVPGARANHRAAKPSEQPATVVAHIALSGAAASEMLLDENSGKQYLYIGANSKKGLTVVDVSKPDQPNVIKHLAWPNDAPSGRLQMVSGGLALAEGPDGDSATDDSRPPTRTVKVIDWSDPANPRTVLSFSGVTSTLAEDARNLVYINNGEGLWILRNNQALAAAAKRQACTSEDAFKDMASCQ